MKQTKRLKCFVSRQMGGARGDREFDPGALLCFPKKRFIALLKHRKQNLGSSLNIGSMALDRSCCSLESSRFKLNADFVVSGTFYLSF